MAVVTVRYAPDNLVHRVDVILDQILIDVNK